MGGHAAEFLAALAVESARGLQLVVAAARWRPEDDPDAGLEQPRSGLRRPLGMEAAEVPLNRVRSLSRPQHDSPLVWHLSSVRPCLVTASIAAGSAGA